MKFFRETAKRIFIPYLGIDQDGGQGGGAPAPEEMLRNAFAGNSVPAEDIPTPESFSQSNDNGGAPHDPQHQQAEPSNQDTPAQATDNWLWEEMNERLATKNNEWKVSDAVISGKKEDGTELSRQERFEMFVQDLQKTASPNEDVQDPFIKAYNIRKQEEGFELSSFLEEERTKQTIMSLDDNTFLNAYLKSLKSEDGKVKHSDAEITEYVNKLNPIEKAEKVKQLKSELQKVQDSVLAEREAALIKKQEESFNAWETSRQKSIEETTMRMSQIKEVAGIPITESDLQEFIPKFDKLTQFNKETGRLYMDDYLQSNNDTVFKMLFLMHKAEKGEIDKHISTVKQTVKDTLFEKLGIKPNITGASSSSGGIEAPTSKAFH